MVYILLHQIPILKDGKFLFHIRKRGPYISITDSDYVKYEIIPEMQTFEVRRIVQNKLTSIRLPKAEFAEIYWFLKEFTLDKYKDVEPVIEIYNKIRALFDTS